MLLGMDDQPESDPITLLSAVSDLKVAAGCRRHLRRGDAEFTLAVSEEVRISQIAFRLGREFRVRGQA